jgi:tetratricopeptide (TPR) repeat protein
MKKIAWLMVALFVFTGLALGQDQPTKKQRRQAEELSKAGDKSYQQRNYRNAIDQFAQSLAIVPVNAEVHAKKANAHFLLQEYDQAVSEINIALSQRYPKPVDLYKIRALARYETNDMDGSLADVLEVLKVEPGNTMYILKQADINSAKGNDRDALSAYQKAVAGDSRNGDLYYKIGSIQMKIGEADAQIAASQEAIKYNTQYLGEAWYVIADGYFKKRQYEPAEQAYVKAIERFKTTNSIRPELYQSYRNLGDIYRRFNRFNDAIRVTRQGIEDYPKDASLWTDLSWYYSLADRNAEAVEAARTAIGHAVGNYLGYTNLCRAYNETGEYQLAINTCNQALRLSPNDGETLFYLGRAYDLIAISAEKAGRTADANRYRREATGNYDKAVAGLVKFTRENPDYSDGYYLLGNAYYADDQTDNAIKAYLKCLELSPRFVKARYNLGILYALSKNKAGAMEQYNSLLSLDQAYATKLKAEIDKL